MRQLIIHLDSGRVVTEDEYKIVGRFIKLLVGLDVLEKHAAFDIIIKSFDKLFV